MKNLKIVALDATNFRKLKCFFVKFKNNGVTLFSGKNEQGKTSALDLIHYAISGNKVVGGDYITNGENKMTVSCKINGTDTDIDVSRTQTPKSSTLEVRVNGNKIKKPQSFLKDLISSFTFDVSKFTMLTPQEKVKFLMDGAGLDFTQINQEIEKATLSRREKGAVKRSYGDCGRPAAVPKPQPINEILAERKAVEEKNNEIYKRNNERESLSRKINALEIQLKAAKAESKKLGQPEATLDGEIAKFNDVIELHAEESRRYDEFLSQNQKFEMVKKLNREYSKLTKHIEELKQKKVTELKKLKIKDVEITENDVFYKGVDSANLSGMQKMMLAIEIAIFQNPDLRAILVEGHELDIQNLKKLDERAKDCNLQVIATYIRNEIPNDKLVDGEYYIENGEITHQSLEVLPKTGNTPVEPESEIYFEF